MSAARFATTLDQLMIEANGGAIAAASTPDLDLPLRTGAEVGTELGGRLLVRYMPERRLGEFAGGSTARHFVTPTPIAPDDTVRMLALPDPTEPRRYAMLIDPAHVPEIQGPRWIKGGDGIEYLLPRGFPAASLVLPWETVIA